MSTLHPLANGRVAMLSVSLEKPMVMNLYAMSKEGCVVKKVLVRDGVPTVAQLAQACDDIPSWEPVSGPEWCRVRSAIDGVMKSGIIRHIIRCDECKEEFAVELDFGNPIPSGWKCPRCKE